MNDNDVLKELELKNKEIYINKLNIDLDKNLESINIMLDNIFLFEQNELVNKILDIENSSINKSNIEKEVQNFLKELKFVITNDFYKRIVYLKEVIDEENLLYDEEIIKEKERILKSLKKSYSKNSIFLINNLSINYDEFTKNRLIEYINKTYFDKIYNKIKELINNTDIILINNYHESNERYQEINNKTLK